MMCPRCKSNPILIAYGMCLKCYMHSKVDEADKVREERIESAKPKRAKPRDLESQLQISCVNWFRLQYPNCLIYSIPNGGSRNKIEAKRLKAEGVIAGVADLFLMEPRNEYHGFYIEMKYGNTNKQSDNQLQFEKMCNERGYLYRVAKSFEEFVKQINDYLNL